MKFIYLLLVLLFSYPLVSQEKITKNDSTNFDKYFIKDFEKDAVVGISLEKGLDYLKNKKGKEIIIAVIDTDIDINHNDLKSIIWVNSKEIPDNNVDDDNNGYIDDIHGWNFIRNKKGEHIIYASTDDIRYVQSFNKMYKSDTLSLDKSLKDIYRKALNGNKEGIKYINKKLSMISFLERSHSISKELMDSLFNKKKYTYKDLDSLKKSMDQTDLKLFGAAKFMYTFFKKNYTGYADKWKPIREEAKKKTYNINYNDRIEIGDNVNDINDISYGSAIINDRLDVFTHGTTVSAVLSNFKNIKIMSLVIFPDYGIETDKDLAVGIRYAVDNGANIINYSSGKIFSFHNKWVQDAIKYAEKKNVMFIQSAGNRHQDNDSNEIMRYPILKYDFKELNNFIVVGASDKKLDKNLIAPFSNYGQQTIHLFAPGKDITTAKVLGGYYQDSGTSMSVPMVGGTAALIMSYFPNLKVKQIKDIILNSVVKYNIDVEIKIDKNKTKLIPFSTLSRTGGILNTYKALKLAEKVSEKKK